MKNIILINNSKEYYNEIDYDNPAEYRVNEQGEKYVFEKYKEVPKLCKIIIDSSYYNGESYISGRLIFKNVERSEQRVFFTIPIHHSLIN